MRKKRNYKRNFRPDAVYGSIALGRFINHVMQDGRKSVAEKIVYDALEVIKKDTKANPLTIFDKAIENVSPSVEVASRRVGGANYQIPREVRPERRFTLAVRWIIESARNKKGKDMAARLAEELMAASNNEGAAIKKKLDVHRVAEANRAFAHFAR
ncbi:MAG: 30S ribosomal protein S7 [Patescibacteria group bacterium]|nr:30S ribosomal protein S7 [Patescibacteria group bacterium]MCL5224304.1 30S ribosomal protein S7 [Patescibacteria group bacterium]